MSNLIYRTTQAILGVFLAADVIGNWYVDYILTHDRPAKRSGAFSIEYPSHGSSTFITNQDHLFSTVLWIGMFALIGISGLVHQFNRQDWREVANRKVFP